jgi:hypothetical protein
MQQDPLENSKNIFLLLLLHLSEKSIIFADEKVRYTRLAKGTG